ncbi:MAG TPA: hypothetical protein VF476_02625 [Chitinophagaceae bacterium]
MEVHHHSATPATDIHRGKKKWTHYFWEFLMLFLAVFCGFLAEYQLEHKIEKDRTKEFAAMLIDDLSSDTAAINRHVKFREKIYLNADSLMHLLKYGSLISDQDKAVKYFSVINDRRLLEAKRGTIEQLKHSGTLRYFRNRKLASELISYYNVLDIIDHWIQYLFDYESATLGPFSHEHYDKRYNDTVFRSQKKLSAFVKMGEEDQILLYNMTETFAHLNKVLAIYVLNEAFEKAGTLIGMIKKEYHLE